jgi:hypothetical protein
MRCHTARCRPVRLGVMRVGEGRHEKTIPTGTPGRVAGRAGCYPAATNFAVKPLPFLFSTSVLTCSVPVDVSM